MISWFDGLGALHLREMKRALLGAEGLHVKQIKVWIASTRYLTEKFCLGYV